MEKNILIFGGGQLQLSLINSAMKMGFKTIVIDPNPKAIAKDISSVFIEVSADDYPRTMEIAKKYKVKGILTAATDHPILMMCKIASALNLNFPDFNSCETILDKGLFKNLLKRNQISHARGAVYRNSDLKNIDELNYPVILKPIRNSGSRGVIKCETAGNLRENITETLCYSNDGRFIIEEFIEGDEISVEAIVYNKIVDIIQITDKIVSDPPYNVELGHIQPSKYLSLKDEIRILLQKIVDYSNLNNCIIHPELKIKNNEITILEIGPRLGGDYITSHLVPLSTGINIEELAINISTNSQFIMERKEMFSMISYLNFPTKSKILNVFSEKELKVKYKGLINYHCSLMVGDEVPKITNSLNRYGHFILQANDRNTLMKLCKTINDNITKQYLGHVEIQ